LYEDIFIKSYVEKYILKYIYGYLYLGLLYNFYAKKKILLYEKYGMLHLVSK